VGKVGVARPDWCGCAGVSNGVDGNFAGDFAGLVTAHSVGDNEEPVTGVTTVLILFSNLANTGHTNTVHEFWQITQRIGSGRVHLGKTLTTVSTPEVLIVN